MKYSDAHTDAARFHLTREDRDLEVIARFTVEGEPVSKARARFTGYGSKVRSYTPARTLEAEGKVRAAFMKAAPSHRPDSTGTFGVTALFFHATRQRRDVDNMLKLLLDGLNKVAWGDDSQVVEVSGRKTPELPGDARTEVVIYRVSLVDAMPTMPCERCGKPFEIYPSNRRRFCSKECVYAARREIPKPPCARCGEPVKLRTNKHCSRECAGLARRKGDAA